MYLTFLTTYFFLMLSCLSNKACSSTASSTLGFSAFSHFSVALPLWVPLILCSSFRCWCSSQHWYKPSFSLSILPMDNIYFLGVVCHSHVEDAQINISSLDFPSELSFNSVYFMFMYLSVNLFSKHLLKINSVPSMQSIAVKKINRVSVFMEFIL